MRLCCVDGRISTGLIRLLGFSHRLLDDLPRWRNATGRPPRRTPDARRGVQFTRRRNADPGDHEHTRYDRNVTDLAVDFLHKKAACTRRQTVSAVLRIHASTLSVDCTTQILSQYDPDTLKLPDTWNEPLESQHPVIQHHRWAWRNDIPTARSHRALCVSLLLRACFVA